MGLSPSYGSIIPLRDGRSVWVWGTRRARKPLHPFYRNISTDGGRTWSDPRSLRLASGQTMSGVFMSVAAKKGTKVAAAMGPGRKPCGSCGESRSDLQELVESQRDFTSSAASTGFCHTKTRVPPPALPTCFARPARRAFRRPTPILRRVSRECSLRIAQNLGATISSQARARLE